MALPDRVPVFPLSGLLGSGKSTLLNEALTNPSLQDTAVIINEFGQVAIDQLLVREGETAMPQAQQHAGDISYRGRRRSPRPLGVQITATCKP